MYRCSWLQFLGNDKSGKHFDTRSRVSRWAVAVLLLTLHQASVSTAGETVTFNRDVRPILSDNCFFCHGPDSARRQADLRLDVRDVAVDSGAIVPGKPDESEMLRRILSHDPDEQMPPPTAKLAELTSAEIETLRKWIIQGAEYEGHWAFLSLSKDASGIHAPADDVTNRIDEIVSNRPLASGFCKCSRKRIAIR